MTSALFDSIARIARHEAAARAVAGVGRVTEVFEGSRNDHAVTVEMRDTGLVLPQVPVAVGVMGFAAIPAVDDLVVVVFADGEVNAPVVVGRLYHPDQPPPQHAEGQIVLHVPSGDPKIELDVEAATPSVKLVMGDVELEILSDSFSVKVGDVTLKAMSSGDRLEASAGGTSIVMKASGEMTLKTDGNFKLQANQIELQAAATLKLAGAQVQIN
jgi:phage baseplate assembly protein gpV